MELLLNFNIKNKKIRNSIIYVRLFYNNTNHMRIKEDLSKKHE